MDKRHREACELTLSPLQVRRVSEYVRANLGCKVRLARLADQVSLSPHYFSMLFKHSLGVSPHHYVLRECIYEAQKRLAGRMSISEVALSLGFSDQSHFSQTFRKMTGTTPKRYQSALLNPTRQGQCGAQTASAFLLRAEDRDKHRTNLKDSRPAAH